MLKFEGRFEVGDIIKAYDFKPGNPEVPDSYIVGQIVDAANNDHGFLAYKVVQIEHVIAGTVEHEDFLTEAWIPMEVSFMEYDERIQKYA